MEKLRVRENTYSGMFYAVNISNILWYWENYGYSDHGFCLTLFNTIKKNVSQNKLLLTKLLKFKHSCVWIISSRLFWELKQKNQKKNQLLCNFIEIELLLWCSPVNLRHIFRTPFLRTPPKGCFWKI